MEPSKVDPRRKVILWTPARSMSTVFLKSVSQLDEVSVLNEPFTPASLLGPQKLPGLYDDVAVDPALTFEAAFDTLCKFEEGRHVFAKILSITIERYKEMLLRDDVKPFKHVFLIRDPKKTVYSLCRLHYAANDLFKTIDRTLTYCFLDIQAHASLYSFVKENFGQNPLILDADDLLQNPEAVMRVFCDHVGFTYDAKMLKWEPGTIPGSENLIWKVAFKDVEESIGFKAPRVSAEEGIPDNEKDLINKTVDQCRPLYEKLCGERFVPCL